MTVHKGNTHTLKKCRHDCALQADRGAFYESWTMHRPEAGTIAAVIEVVYFWAKHEQLLTRRGAKEDVFTVQRVLRLQAAWCAPHSLHPPGPWCAKREQARRTQEVARVAYDLTLCRIGKPQTGQGFGPQAHQKLIDQRTTLRPRSWWQALLRMPASSGQPAAQWYCQQLGLVKQAAEAMRARQMAALLASFLRKSSVGTGKLCWHF